MAGPKIELDKALFDKVKKHVEANGYSSPEEFVTHLIERELAAVQSRRGSIQDQGHRLHRRGPGYLT